MGKANRSIAPKVKFHVVLEALKGEKTLGHIAKAYGVHPVSVGLWKKHFLEQGAEIFAREGTRDQSERRVAELEQLLGKKEVEIALQKNFLRHTP